jgi:glycosyltransferase involved in cell wall biosynthesis
MLIAVSEEEAGEALRLGYARERVFLIRNGVAACEAGAVTVREDGALRVGFFGRLARQKGPDVLLEAVADVVAHLPLTRFSFTGDGELAEPLRARAEALGLTAVVAFAGACAQGETVARMREVDVVAAPSRWEGCPYVALEAFQAGVPLVASAVGGVPDLVQSGVNGVLVAAEDPEALGDALLGLLREPHKRRRLAEQGRVTAGHCGLGAMAAAVGGVYRRVARPR